MENIIFIFLIICLVAVCVIPILLTFTPGSNVWYDKKHGMKYTLTDDWSFWSFTAEWDFSSPFIRLRLLKLFIQGEFDTEKRNKYVKEYSRLKKSLEKAGYDLSDFPDYEQK